MILCVNCGVELDDGLKVCPLCGRDPLVPGEKDYIRENRPSDIIQLQKKESKEYLWELSGIIAFSGIVLCTIIDLVISKGLKWSLLSDISIFSTWLFLTLYLFSPRRIITVVVLTLLIILFVLFLIDLVVTGRPWFFSVGLPVTIAAFLFTGILIILFREAHMKGLNFIATSFIALSGLSIVTELILDKFINGSVDLRWSLILSVSVLPVALVLLFYHYRLKKGNRLDSLFHI